MLYEPTIEQPGICLRYEWVDELTLIKTGAGPILFHSNRLRYTPEENDLLKNIGNGKHELYKPCYKTNFHVGVTQYE